MGPGSRRNGFPFGFRPERDRRWFPCPHHLKLLVSPVDLSRIVRRPLLEWPKQAVVKGCGPPGTLTRKMTTRPVGRFPFHCWLGDSRTRLESRQASTARLPVGAAKEIALHSEPERIRSPSRTLKSKGRGRKASPSPTTRAPSVERSRSVTSSDDAPLLNTQSAWRRRLVRTKRRYQSMNSPWRHDKEGRWRVACWPRRGPDPSFQDERLSCSPERRRRPPCGSRYQARRLLVLRAAMRTVAWPALARRYPAPPRPAMPSSIIAQVEGSGVPGANPAT